MFDNIVTFSLLNQGLKFEPTFSSIDPESETFTILGNKN